MSSKINEEKKDFIDEMSISYKRILHSIEGENASREGLEKTPMRAAKAFAYFTHGYLEKPRDILNDAIFGEESRSLVLCKNIRVYSLCEHHLVPFFGSVRVFL